MKTSVSISEISTEGLFIEIEHTIGADNYKVVIGSSSNGIEMSKDELLTLKALITEITEVA